MRPDTKARERAEIDFWDDFALDDRGFVDNVINKAGEAGVFIRLLDRYAALFPERGRILELGAGEGWASCLVKKFRPSATVIATELAQTGIDGLKVWEHIWGVRIDQAYACPSYKTREADASVDLAFCFAAAHHFGDHPATLAELRRILKPGGVAIYLYEPTTPAYIYPLAYWRANRLRRSYGHGVHEDLLVPARFRAMSQAAGLDCRFDRYPATDRRRATALLYFSVLKALPPLQAALPCTANIVIAKAHRAV